MHCEIQLTLPYWMKYMHLPNHLLTAMATLKFIYFKTKMHTSCTGKGDQSIKIEKSTWTKSFIIIICKYPFSCHGSRLITTSSHYQFVLVSHWFTHTVAEWRINHMVQQIVWKCQDVQKMANENTTARHLSSFRSSKSSGLMDEQGSKPGRQSEIANKSNREQAKREARVQEGRSEQRSGRAVK